jgi:hypothetical protein
MKKLIPVLATLLVVAAGATAHHLYKNHSRFGHAPLIKGTLPSSHLEERSVNIHDARVPVRTEKDQESEAKVEPETSCYCSARNFRLDVLEQ